jgi:prepilin-type N-terminal cleavage/methylation domain-containing protein
VTSFARTLVAKTQKRLSSERAFTLIEMVNVMLILSILMSISFSEYTSLHLRAEQKQAASNISVLAPALTSWRSDHGTYVGMTMALLNADYLASSLNTTYYTIGSSLGTDTYCVQYTVPTGDYTAKVDQSGTITVGHNNACT